MLAIDLIGGCSGDRGSHPWLHSYLGSLPGNFAHVRDGENLFVTKQTFLFFSATFATELFLTGWMTGWQKFSFFVTNFIPNSVTRIWIDCPFLLKTVSPSLLFKLFFFHGHLVQGSRSCCGIVARWATSLTPSSTPCTTTAPPSSASTLGGLFTDKSKVGNILQVDGNGNCARPLWSGRQLMRGGKTWKGFRSSWFYSFPLTLYSLHYLSFLFTPNHQNDQRHNDKTYLRPQNSHFSFACISFGDCPWLYDDYQGAIIPMRSLSWPASRTNTTRCLQSLWNQWHISLLWKGVRH